MGMGSAEGSSVAETIRRSQRADGPATVLAIGTANPANCISQDAYPDYYFRVTKTDHLSEVKERLTRLCKRSGTKKRFFHHDEALLDGHPELVDNASPSLDARLDIVKTAVPELAASACRKAIAEWGRPAADITHLVVATSAGAHAPGVDFRLVQLLGLRASVRRTMLYHNACVAGAAALRLAKDLAENTGGARVLVVCAEITLTLFSAPEEGDFNTLVNQGLFGDGAGAVVVGADPVSCERSLFEIVSAEQTIVPDSEDAIAMQLTNRGLRLSSTKRRLPVLIGDSIERCLLDAFSPLGLDLPSPGWKWNDLFWVVHPGTSGILDRIDAVLQLQPHKLEASRRVLSDYGNMWGATVIFVLDEMRKHHTRPAPHQPQAGDGLELQWGVLMAFGPGVTVETMVLRAPSNTTY